ncbi:MAG: Rieske 2Fe-2S domain-containing protein [Rhodobacterales bacterium]|nr:Rieske 2Fe-2S domain-containing protein [Rhodobacterales bacterium]
MPPDSTDIRRASLPPGAMYGDPTWSARLRKHVVQPAWTLLHAVNGADARHNAVPVDIADAPLVYIQDAAGERLLSNACTHRGALVCEQSGQVRSLRCRYHGRRFGLDGRFKSAPGFERAIDFPSKSDHLRAASLGRFGPWRFGAVQPPGSFESWIAPIRDRMAWYDWDALQHDPSRDHDYQFEAAWPLYVDNYLEGFHVPFVHPGLAGALDLSDYRVETLGQAVLQIGIADRPEDAFDLPADCAEHGQSIAAYYWWLFPNLMINVYPWGVSLNLVDDLGPRTTRIRYRTWIADSSKLGEGAGAGLDTVEFEDQAVVRSAQRGVLSPLYTPGRYAPDHEVGTFYFHALIQRALDRGPGATGDGSCEGG